MKNIIQRQNFESHVLRELRMVENRLNLLHDKMGKVKHRPGPHIENDKTKKLISKTDLLVEVAQKFHTPKIFFSDIEVEFMWGGGMNINTYIKPNLMLRLG